MNKIYFIYSLIKYNMNIIYYNHLSRIKTKIDLNNDLEPKINFGSQDRLMIPNESNYNDIEWIKKYIIPSSIKYTLYERDQYLVFFFI